MKNRKKLIVIIVVALTVVSGVLAYLFLMTDAFKSSKKLFAQYFIQNEQVINNITDIKAFEVYGNLKNENKYELNSNIKLEHSEGGEISNPLNNLSAKVTVQQNKDEEYLYMDGQILCEDEKYLEAEIIKEQEKYGIRFTDSIKQFVTIRNDENIETVANNLGVDLSVLQELMEKIDGNEVIKEQQLTTLKDKYLNIIKKVITEGKYEKQRNALITYNNVTTKTNAYSVSLTSEQVQKMLIEILNNLKNETEILDRVQTIIDKETLINKISETIDEISEEAEVPTIKITVYEQKQQTIRTVIEIGMNKFTIENVEQNNEIKTKVSYLDNNVGGQADLEILKQNIDGQEEFSISLSVIEGEEKNIISFSNVMIIAQNEIQSNTEISYKQDITKLTLGIENKVKIESDFEKAISLDSSNNMTLNDLEEQKRILVVNFLKQQVPNVFNKRIDMLKQKIGLTENEEQEEETEPEITQTEINKFNSKFEFYTGEEVSTENVKTLLGIAKNHLRSYQNIEEIEENSGNSNLNKPKMNIQLNIEKDIYNDEAVNEILEKMNNNKKYKVLIFYKQEDGLIDYITITEI